MQASGERVFQENRTGNAKDPEGMRSMCEEQLGGHRGWREVNKGDSGTKPRSCPGVKPSKGLEATGGASDCPLRVMGSHWKETSQKGSITI